MRSSQKGLEFIRGFEGYLKPLPDGGCVAYLCPAGVPTIGWGCTEGVKIGDVWTRQQAEDAFRREIAKHEAAVRRLVSVDITQGQFDALVSFSYNVGSGALAKSTLLKKLNRGDYAGAQAEFMKWNKAAGKQLRGLSRRRAAEAAMFAERSHQDDGVPSMPQKIDEPKAPMADATKVTTSVAAGGVATTVATEIAKAPANLPSPPAGVTDAIGNVGLWQSIAENAKDFAVFLADNPALAGALVLIIAGVWLAPKLRRAEA